MPPRISANRTGIQLEQSVDDLVQQAGYKPVPDRSLFFAMRVLRQSIYTRQAETGTDIYGKKRRVDFILYNPQKWPDSLIIQCKWQAVSGSVEEKYPFEVLSIRANQPPAIIVLDGGGYSEGSKRWLKGEAGQGHLRHVFDLGEFQRFVAGNRL